MMPVLPFYSRATVSDQQTPAESQSPSYEIASIFFGTFIGLFFFTATKVTRQSLGIIRRKQSIVNCYLWMIWMETIVNLIFALTTYLFIRGNIKPSLAYYVGAVVLWTLQTQLLLQIIANRVGLILVSRRKARLIRWGLVVVIGLVNISVFCIWIPAHMNVSETFIRLNHIWERVEKSIFLVVDLSLNVYFLHAVRSQLIVKGLTKYWRLFNFNAAIVVLSVAMDLLLIGLLSLKNPFDYVQFAPVAYIVKLNIELTMASLITSIVRGASRVEEIGSRTNMAHNGTHLRTINDSTNMKHQVQGYFPGQDLESSRNSTGKADTASSTSKHKEYEGTGIVKTVTMFLSENDD